MEHLMGWTIARNSLEKYGCTDRWYPQAAPLPYTINKDNIIVTVPGYASEDFSIEAVGNTLKVLSTDGKHIYDFVINRDVVVEEIKATCDRGILRITMPGYPVTSRKIVVG